MLERVFWFAVSLALLVLGFFFLAVALAAGAILAAVLLVRVWWLKRRMRRGERDRFITTEYTVVEREPLPPAEGRSPEGGSPEGPRDHPATFPRGGDTRGRGQDDPPRE